MYKLSIYLVLRINKHSSRVGQATPSPPKLNTELIFHRSAVLKKHFGLLGSWISTSYQKSE